MQKHALESIKLYRAGDPSEGAGFWTPSERYAREAHPEATEMHEAIVLPEARVNVYSEPFSALILQTEREAGDHDILVFQGPALECVVLNPAVLRILK